MRAEEHVMEFQEHAVGHETEHKFPPADFRELQAIAAGGDCRERYIRCDGRETAPAVSCGGCLAPVDEPCAREREHGERAEENERCRVAARDDMAYRPQSECPHQRMTRDAQN